MKKHVSIIVCIVIAGFGSLYYAGYRIGTFGVGKIGTLVMEVPLVNTDIIIDTKEKITTTKDGEKANISLYPGEHQVIVSRAGYFPWTKKLIIHSGEAVRLDPLFITQNTTGQIITTYDPEHYQIRSTVIENKIPTKSNPRISSDGTVRAWVEDNVILIQTGDTVHTVIAPEPIVRNVEFYKNRSDALLFSAGDSVFVIETDQSSDNIQNILPVYRGATPFFAPHDAGSIYVLDENKLMAVVI